MQTNVMFPHSAGRFRLTFRTLRAVLLATAQDCGSDLSKTAVLHRQVSVAHAVLCLSQETLLIKFQIGA